MESQAHRKLTRSSSYRPVGQMAVVRAPVSCPPLDPVNGSPDRLQPGEARPQNHPDGTLDRSGGLAFDPEELRAPCLPTFM